MKLLCKIGIHRNKKIIGIAPFFYDISKQIIALGCKDCGKKLKNAVLVPVSLKGKKEKEIINYIKKYL